MTDEETKRYDLIVEYVNRAKLALHAEDEIGEMRNLKEAKSLLEKLMATPNAEPAA